MQINHSFEPEFDKLWKRLESKYPEALFDIDGVGKQLDSCEFAREFFGSNVAADSSIDPNANVTNNSIIVYNTESDKPLKKLRSFHELWVQLKNLYGKKVADEIIEMQISGDIYIHDAHGIDSGMPYCFNYTCYDIMNQGLSVVNNIKCLPPKYFTAFKSQLEQFTV
jgi:anaerobic ribonucleoside-triphosphate reductase